MFIITPRVKIIFKTHSQSGNYFYENICHNQIFKLMKYYKIILNTKYLGSMKPIYDIVNLSRLTDYISSNYWIS